MHLTLVVADRATQGEYAARVTQALDCNREPINKHNNQCFHHLLVLDYDIGKFVINISCESCMFCRLNSMELVAMPYLTDQRTPFKYTTSTKRGNLGKSR